MSSAATAGLAEAYVMRKLHKEKMKKMDSDGNKLMISSSEEKAADSFNHEGKSSSSGFGCFPLLSFKKVHPNAMFSSDS
ncbi:hypothetical protein CDL12_23642 [Handroanthus impetiginosus]|uniref:Uncharacterized protein n=1 Tax=Handroanthus impetiginosus TaxID=429701 RepID=A0A2G9GF63_9LAMI|nr:hypothetical protein CDL12_23642 [Handroanthus impetiginosus]